MIRPKTQKARPGAKLLRQYVRANKKKGVSWRKLAGAVGVKHPTVWQWGGEEAVPKSLTHRLNLERATDGYVPADSWLSEEELSAQADRSARLAIGVEGAA